MRPRSRSDDLQREIICTLQNEMRHLSCYIRQELRSEFRRLVDVQADGVGMPRTPTPSTNRNLPRAPQASKGCAQPPPVTDLSLPHTPQGEGSVHPVELECPPVAAKACAPPAVMAAAWGWGAADEAESSISLTGTKDFAPGWRMGSPTWSEDGVTVCDLVGSPRGWGLESPTSSKELGIRRLRFVEPNSEVKRAISKIERSEPFRPEHSVKRFSSRRRKKAIEANLKEELRRVTSEMKKASALQPGTEPGHKYYCMEILLYYVQCAVYSDIFDYIMGVIVFLSSLMIGLQVNYGAENVHETRPPNWLVATNVSFCILFTLELLARIATFGRRFFVMDGWKWNVFDMVVAVISIFDEVAQVLLVGSSVQEIIDRIGILRMLRVGRLLRLIRMVRLIPELKSLVYLITSSMGAFFWTIILMLLLMYCVAIYFTQVATEMRLDVDALLDERMVGYWGSIQNSIFTLFMAITGGDDWRNCVEALSVDFGANVHVGHAVVFSCYVAWASLVMLNLVTGVFVEGAQRIIQQDRRKETICLAAKFFVDADIDDSTDLSFTEFKQLLGTSRMEQFLDDLQIDDCEASGLFHAFDADGSGEISLMEFVMGCLRLGCPATTQDVVKVVRGYKAMQEELQDGMAKLRADMSRMDGFLKYATNAAYLGQQPEDV
eukprot:TRINITY_DN43674_c0_g1_i1.p1 TRINITY_DN43674_c0_g1~~TRINITY_DN43674_c0_g1_i1.p1  ORF type:complete len:663 (+),score=133.68 TRINITY_DN43674_c0_g1_i1:69-2057(+)